MGEEEIIMGPPYSQLVVRLQDTFGLPSQVANIVVKFLDDEGVLDYDNLKEIYFQEVEDD